MMNFVHRFGLLWTTALVMLASFGSGSALLRGSDPKEEPAHAFAKLQSGMSPEQVRQLVGAPKRVTRQIFYHRYREQWIYDTPVPLRLTFDCPRGQKPQLLTDGLASPKR
jgi:hypothetical protein